jgi:hypothetical protein
VARVVSRKVGDWFFPELLVLFYELDDIDSLDTETSS